MSSGGISENEYRALAEFRHQLRRFLRASEQAARDAGLEPQQHQLMLAVKGMPHDVPCTIGDVAGRLQIQHHSTVELADRLVKRGYILRKPGGEDRRQVLLQVTARGEKALQRLSLYHRQELRVAMPDFFTVMQGLLGSAAKASKPRSRRPGTAARQAKKSA